MKVHLEDSGLVVTGQTEEEFQFLMQWMDRFVKEEEGGGLTVVTSHKCRVSPFNENVAIEYWNR